jgi:hypothetical protein
MEFTQNTPQNLNKCCEGFDYPVGGYEGRCQHYGNCIETLVSCSFCEYRDGGVCYNHPGINGATEVSPKYSCSNWKVK